MKKVIQGLIIIPFVILYLQVSAEQARQLSWKDLVPADMVTVNPFAGLSEEQKNLLIWVISWYNNLSKSGQKADEDLMKEIDDATRELKDSGIDIRQMIAKIDEIRSSIVEELNGQRVRIPGYLLPLEASGSKVTEFLLVPYVGACIHVPPPPPNQIIHVKVNPKEGYKNKGLFEPVWVTGKISAKSMVKDLYLVDGSADINIGYALQANRIEPYKQ
jgi:hypothetical protein